MAAPSPAALVFPHPTLTKIIGKPSYETLRQLRKEIYANARTIHSTRGGGANGHLAIIMPDIDYQLRTIGIGFTIPTHPGSAPVHAGFASPVDIDASNKLWERNVSEYNKYYQVSDCLKAQLLVAIDPTYIKELEDAEFGYADITPLMMVEHLNNNYGQLKPEQRGTIRDALRAPWNPDDPIEDIWTRTNEIVRTLALTEPVPATAIIRDQLFVFETTGVFPRACEAWREKDLQDQTLDNFKIHFARYNEERTRTLTAKQAGYHATTRTPPVTPSVSTAAAHAVTPESPHIVTNDVKMYYCWTHGLGTNPKHCSNNCNKKADGHKNDATADNMKDGNDRIMKPWVRRTIT